MLTRRQESRVGESQANVGSYKAEARKAMKIGSSSNTAGNMRTTSK